MCPEKTYPDKTTLQCQSCDSKCRFCFGSTVDNCTSCETNLVLNNFTCATSCPTNYTVNQWSVCVKAELYLKISTFLLVVLLGFMIFGNWCYTKFLYYFFWNYLTLCFHLVLNNFIDFFTSFVVDRLKIFLSWTEFHYFIKDSHLSLDFISAKCKPKKSILRLASSSLKKFSLSRPFLHWWNTSKFPIFQETLILIGNPMVFLKKQQNMLNRGLKSLRLKEPNPKSLN